MRFLTVSGSLRAGSSNAALLTAIARLAPDHVDVVAFDGLRDIPAFLPDADGDDASVTDAVRHWRVSLARADAVLFSSPEYAHGVPGVLKNALDWVVGSGELVDKPVGLLCASAASGYAHPQLLETLRVMSAALVPDAIAIVDVPRRGVTAEALLGEPALRARLRQIVTSLHDAVPAPSRPHRGHDGT